MAVHVINCSGVEPFTLIGSAQCGPRLEGRSRSGLAFSWPSVLIKRASDQLQSRVHCARWWVAGGARFCSWLTDASTVLVRIVEVVVFLMTVVRGSAHR